MPILSALKSAVKIAFDRWFWPASKEELRALLKRYPNTTFSDMWHITKEYQGKGWYKRLGAYQVESEFRQMIEWGIAQRPSIIAEIGTANGGTLFMWSRIASKRVISIDMPGGIHGGGYAEPKGRLFREFVADRPGVSMILLARDSQAESTRAEVLQHLGTEKVDIFFIDGDHRLEGVTRDFNLWKSVVRPGGHIVFHDILPHATIDSCQVHILWKKIKEDYPGKTREFIESQSQGWGGIGVLEV